MQQRRPRKTGKKIVRYWQLYFLLLIPIAYIIIFKYVPMSGLVIAFKNFKARKGIWASPWVGFDNFTKFFNSYQFSRVLKNTVILSLYTIIAGFPIPILFALAINCIQKEKLKKITTTIVNLPHFISTVVIVGIVFMLFNCRTGLYGQVGHLLLGEYPQDIFADTAGFRNMYVWSGVWQNFGWNSIVYTAALSNVDPNFHEAAQIDGATRFQRVIHVDFPTILPTIVTMLILRMGSIMSLGYEKVLLMQNPLNLSASEIISTYVYEVGLSGSGSGNFSYAAAIDMFNNVINLAMVITVNQISKKLSDTSLW